MIIVPDDPGPAGPDEVLKAAVRRVFDGDGFLANVWHPYRQAWVERVNRRPIGTPYRRAKGTPLALRGSVDAGHRFRAAGGVGRA